MTVVTSLFAYHQRCANTQLSAAYLDLSNKQDQLTYEQGQTLQEKHKTGEALNKYRRLSVMLAAERFRVLAEHNDPNHALLWLASAWRMLRKTLTTSNSRSGPTWPAFGGNISAPPIEPSLQINEQIVAKSPDGKTLITHLLGLQPFRLIEAATGKSIGEPIWVGSFGLHAAFFPDGKRFVTLLSKTKDKKTTSEVRLWDAATAQPLSPIREVPGDASFLTISPDGKRFLTCHGGGIARLWDGETCEVLTITLDHQAPLRSESGKLCIVQTASEF